MNVKARVLFVLSGVVLGVECDDWSREWYVVSTVPMALGVTVGLDNGNGSCPL